MLGGASALARTVHVWLYWVYTVVRMYCWRSVYGQRNIVLHRTAFAQLDIYQAS